MHKTPYTCMQQYKIVWSCSISGQCRMPRTAPTTPVLLCFNCGFARCAVKEITAQLAAEKFVNTARDVNTVKRAERFQALVRQAPFGITTTTTSNIPPPFDVHCQAVLDAFKTGWSSQCKRQEYCMTFSLNKWWRLTQEEKANYSLQQCTACAIQHADLHKAFPGPTFEPNLRSVYHTNQHPGRWKGQWREQCYNMWTPIMRYVRSAIEWYMTKS